MVTEQSVTQPISSFDVEALQTLADALVALRAADTIALLKIVTCHSPAEIKSWFDAAMSDFNRNCWAASVFSAAYSLASQLATR